MLKWAKWGQQLPLGGMVPPGPASTTASKIHSFPRNPVEHPAAGFPLGNRLMPKSHDMPFVNQILARLRRRLWIGEFLRATARWLALYLLIFGATVLGIKMFAPDQAQLLFAGLLVLPGIILWGIHRANGNRMAPHEMVPYLDHQAEAGGLLMTLWENPDPAWHEKLPISQSSQDLLPAIIPEPFLRAIAIPAMFLAGALALPTRQLPPPMPRDTAASRVTNDLREAIHLLSTYESVNASTRTQLESEVNRLTEAIAGKPLSHESWETVDALKEQMWTAVKGRDQSLQQGEAALGTLARLLESGDTLDADSVTRLQSELVTALPSMDLEQLRRSLPPEVQSNPAMQAAITRGKILPLQELMKNPALISAALPLLQGEIGRERKDLDTLRQSLGRTLWDVNAPSSPGASLLGAQADSHFATTDSPRKASPATAAAPLSDSVTAPKPGPSSPAELAGTTEKPSGNASPSANARQLEIPSESITEAETWSRSLRPRHRQVVQRYFGMD